MNDRHDDLASAWLDGELADDELATASTDPAVRQARAELGAVSERLGEPVEVPEAVRSANLAAALAAFDELAAREDRPNVVPMRRRSTFGASLLSRAAVALLVVGGIGLGVAALSDTDRGDDDSAAMDAATLDTTAAEGELRASEAAPAEGGGATSADESELTEEAQGGGSTDAPEAAEGSLAPEPAAVAAGRLAEGDVSPADLLLELVGEFGPLEGWAPASSTPSVCPELVAELHEGPPVLVLPIDLADRAVELVAPGTADPVADAYLVDTASCTVLG